MSYISKEIDELSINLNFKKINLRDEENFHNKIIKKFSFNENYHYPLWEELKNCYSVYDPDGWKKIHRFLKNKEVLLFFEKSDDQTVYHFQNGAQVSDLISECSGFIFYVTDMELNFLLCFNDHDYLIACGVAKKWLEDFVNEDEK